MKLRPRGLWRRPTSIFRTLDVFQRTGGKWLRADHHPAICRKLTDVFEGRTTG
jgi:hypothetical protein